MADRDAADGPARDGLVRPAPHRWLWYALGGALPTRNRSWVLHDTTTGTWWARHIARSLVQMSIPIALVMALMPAPLGLRLAAAGGTPTDGFSLPRGDGPGERIAGLPQFVTVLGGAYFFLPGIRALRFLATAH